jgi:hypothetical protein
MTSFNGYKIAFWALLLTVLVIQVSITVVAHARHDESHQLLQLRGGHHPLTSQKHVAGALPADALKSAPPDRTKSKVWQEVLSTSPKIILLHNFATKEE